MRNIVFYVLLCLPKSAMAEDIYLVKTGLHMMMYSQEVVQPFGVKPVCKKMHPSRGCLEVSAEGDNRVVRTPTINQNVNILVSPVNGGWDSDLFFATQRGLPPVGRVKEKPADFRTWFTWYTGQPAMFKQVSSCMAYDRHSECMRYEPKCIENDEGFCVKYSPNASDASCIESKEFFYCGMFYEYRLDDAAYRAEITMPEVRSACWGWDDCQKLKAAGVNPAPDGAWLHR